MTLKAKIYTKTGDKGQTSLVGGARVSKSNARLHAYGTVDELNSVLGILRSSLGGLNHPEFNAELESSLQAIQNNLFNIGSRLACEDKKLVAQLPHVHAGDLASLEKQMDAWEAELPMLREFILPGGSVAASYCHLARTVCRRCERAIVALSLKKTEKVELDTEIVIYVNRLSDWFFLLARKCNHLLGVKDIVWSKG